MAKEQNAFDLLMEKTRPTVIEVIYELGLFMITILFLVFLAANLKPESKATREAIIWVFTGVGMLAYCVITSAFGKIRENRFARFLQTPEGKMLLAEVNKKDQ